MFFVATILTTQQGRTGVDHRLLCAKELERAQETARSLLANQALQVPEADVTIEKLEPIDDVAGWAMSLHWPVVGCDASSQDFDHTQTLKQVSEQVSQALALSGTPVEPSVCYQVFNALVTTRREQALTSDEAGQVGGNAAPDSAGPRIFATFIPQAYAGGSVIEIEGRRQIDVTEQVLCSDLVHVHTLLDHDASSDKFIDIVDLEHAGPYSVELEQAICSFFDVEDVTDISELMLALARERWQQHGEWSIAPEPQLIVTNSAPLSWTDRLRMGWQFDVAMPVPRNVQADAQKLTDYVSVQLTGSEKGLTLQSVKRVFGMNESVGPVMRLKGSFSKPEDYFDAARVLAVRNRFADRLSRRMMLRALVATDVVEVETSGQTQRLRIVDLDRTTARLLTQLQRLSSEDWREVARAVVLALQPTEELAGSELEKRFTLADLASAHYQSDGSFRLGGEDSQTFLRFF